ncbi:hypothetical protein BU17DRAFT_96934 [Hysterangium stoloniferum]|nr:hypothetical protein BU17DRAFT_96934 [Hysterangium stoloniferum]
MATHSLQNEPAEILDMIILEVEDPRDLLALALTCREFKMIIIPMDLYFRNVSYTLGDHHFWETMSKKRRCLAGIRQLHLDVGPSDDRSLRNIILPSDPLPPPSYFNDAYTTESRTLLAGLTRYMTHLESFRADKLLLPDCSVDGLVHKICENRPNLKALGVTVLLLECIRSGQFTHNTVPLLNHKHLTQIAISIRDDNAKAFGHKMLDCLIGDCPHLAKLYLRYCYLGRRAQRQALNLIQLFKYGNWPQLSHLNLSTTLRSLGPPLDNQDIVSQFFDRHQKLEALAIDKSRDGSTIPNPTAIRILPGSLPRLKAFSSSSGYPSPRDNFPPELLHQLTFWEATLEDFNDHPILDLLLPLSLQSLQTCIVECTLEGFRKLVEAAPNIEKLSLRISNPFNNGRYEEYEEVIQYFIDVILSMTHLTHLAGFTEELNPIHDEDAMDLLRQLAAVKTLMWVSIECGLRTTWISLKRCATTGEYTGYHPANEVSDVSTWGGIFKGPWE